jgi:hypothetical protein
MRWEKTQYCRSRRPSIWLLSSLTGLSFFSSFPPSGLILACRAVTTFYETTLTGNSPLSEGHSAYKVDKRKQRARDKSYRDSGRSKATIGRRRTLGAASRILALRSLLPLVFQPLPMPIGCPRAYRDPSLCPRPQSPFLINWFWFKIEHIA